MYENICKKRLYHINLLGRKYCFVGLGNHFFAFYGYISNYRNKIDGIVLKTEVLQVLQTSCSMYKIRLSLQYSK